MAVTNDASTFELTEGQEIHRLGFGAMRITGDGILGEPDDVENAHRVLEHALDCGVDFIDTADSYGPGTSERLIREAIQDRYDEVVVATKGGLLRNPESDWIAHGDPDYLIDAVLSSVDRLGVDSIDLYQYHRPDDDVPFEDSLQALGRMQDDGYIETVGLSNVSVEQLDRARDLLDVATVQNRYNVANRDHEAVLQACEDADIGFIPWFPLGGGNFGDKQAALEAVANDHDASPRQIALAWLLDHSPVILPIPGTSSIEHLEANVEASHIELTDDDRDRLE